MGFDWLLYIYAPIDPTTGIPSWLDKDFAVPVNYRRFLSMRGHMFHAYTDPIEEMYHTLNCSPTDMLHYFPDWDDVQGEYTVKDYDWTEADHTLLKEALTWFADKGCFKIEWSY